MTYDEAIELMKLNPGAEARHPFMAKGYVISLDHNDEPSACNPFNGDITTAPVPAELREDGWAVGFGLASL